MRPSLLTDKKVPIGVVSLEPLVRAINKKPLKVCSADVVDKTIFKDSLEVMEVCDNLIKQSIELMNKI